MTEEEYQKAIAGNLEAMTAQGYSLYQKLGFYMTMFDLKTSQPFSLTGDEKLFGKESK